MSLYLPHDLIAASMGPSLRSDGDKGCVASSHDLRIASMGPSLRSDGDVDFAGHCRADLLASMGPSLRSDGDVAQKPSVRISGSLQWGRRSAATETGNATGTGIDSDDASMGPSLRSDGDRSSY